MIVDVLTLFPGMFEGVLSESILKIAREKGAIEVRLHNIRDYTENKHRKVDDKPYGGGPGMLMTPQPVVDTVEAVRGDDEEAELIFLSPQGVRFNQKVAGELAGMKRLILVCGRYEGFDERILLALKPREISVGDYVLTGGEIPAMAVIDAVARLLPGVLGDPDSVSNDSFQDDLLDFPQYTRPPEYRGLKVPDVLLSGNHQEISRWRSEQAIKRTRQKRADLLNNEGEPT
ncbi:MAG: tRNA (guanosine(37)-N1)-methyltransferase TrmD [Planctomycetota bacterium]|jgi:tRNA (guanine37-N1)-methyltransferase|nr:tRNA (guanosine(37)-N1)-methyltransferase TrmD [Planctomycetota bacterium]MDP7134917.1 tRNA (guanosine(37)-N1)-methyltransferase TrmD [Planctomycetota bacterium]MDP7252458.1 tRNA (guanosine(37)-N1)-methyltransferase TrmD [Planctomycetota bacterium]